MKQNIIIKHCVSRMALAALATVLILRIGAAAEQTVGTEEREARQDRKLSVYMNKYPDADANGDGILTVKERDIHRQQMILEKFPSGATNFSVMAPMRDGIKLATEVFLPPGDGPWPVVLTRSVYGRWSAALRDVGLFGKHGVAFVTQDLRGIGDSEGRDTFDPFSFDNEIEDSYDAVEWVARQKWCNGQVGMQGTSGHGFAGFMAMPANPSHLKVVSTINSGGNAYLYWTFHNGARRSMYDWMANRGVKVPKWPKPTLQLFDLQAYEKILRQSAVSNQTVFIASSGWYDIFAESLLDYMAVYGSGGRVFIRMGASGHGAMQGRAFPRRRYPAKVKMPELIDILKDNAELPEQSVLLYYLMGDVVDENAQGNVWKTAHAWPLPHTPTPFYLAPDGGLSRERSDTPDANRSYIYSPTNPVPTMGGAMMGSPGPVDQRPLADRCDILRFVSKPLPEPLEITGNLRANLFISTDVDDTMFVVKLIDVYPDGYEAIIREGAMTARFWQGLDQSVPLENGRIYKLDIDMWSTAYVFNAGHRLAVHVSGSDSPKYETHPNTYEPCWSYADAPDARHTIYLSGDHASCVILPVIGD